MAVSQQGLFSLPSPTLQGPLTWGRVPYSSILFCLVFTPPVMQDLKERKSSQGNHDSGCHSEPQKGLHGRVGVPENVGASGHVLLEISYQGLG